MSSLFKGQLIKIQDPGQHYKPGTRELISGSSTIAENIPCRITGTGVTTQLLVLFILRKYYELIPGGVHKGFIVTTDDNLSYTVLNEPVWAGGTKHHIEVDVDVFK